MTNEDLTLLSDEELLNEFKLSKLAIVVNNNFQLAMKILLNGGYGALSQITFLYYKLENAEAITLTGQAINKFINTRLEKFLQKLAKTDKQLWIMADTDSGYFNLEPIVNMICKGETDKGKIADKINEFVVRIVQPEINRLSDEYMDYTNGRENKMVYEREVITDAAIVCAKKKYVMSVIDNEGVRFTSPKYKITGMESKKSSTPGWARKSLKECYILALAGDESVLHEKIESVRKEFYEMDTSKIAIPRGVNNIQKYIDNETGLYQKGTPMNVKAAIVHNWLVKKKGLDIDPLMSGNKIRYIKLKVPNPIRQEVIGFESKFPKEFDLEQYVDREGIFEAAFIKPLQIFLDAVKWQTEKTVSLSDFFA